MGNPNLTASRSRQIVAHVGQLCYSRSGPHLLGEGHLGLLYQGRDRRNCADGNRSGLEPARSGLHGIDGSCWVVTSRLAEITEQHATTCGSPKFTFQRMTGCPHPQPPPGATGDQHTNPGRTAAARGQTVIGANAAVRSGQRPKSGSYVPLLLVWPSLANADVSMATMCG
jgi:hypothetical protein